MLFSNNNYLKLLFKLVLSRFVYFLYINKKTTLSNGSFLNFFILSSKVLLTFIILRFSSILQYCQSLDFFSYNSSLVNNTTAVYLFFLKPFFNYINLFSLSLKTKIKYFKNYYTFSVTSIFSNYWWLEREAAELTDILFFNKFDNRNLLLEYFILFKPMLRTFPSFGIYELFYDTFNFNLIHSKPSLQL